MFDLDSRYADTPEATLKAADGREIAYKQRRFLPQGEALSLLTEVEVREGDRLDLIAARTLGEATQWWRVADANEAFHPEELVATPGRRLRVPVPENPPR